jgi:hypothetical protein
MPCSPDDRDPPPQEFGPKYWKFSCDCIAIKGELNAGRPGPGIDCSEEIVRFPDDAALNVKF